MSICIQKINMYCEYIHRKVMTKECYHHDRRNQQQTQSKATGHSHCPPPPPDHQDTV